jgi:hypothetical protein
LHVQYNSTSNKQAKPELPKQNWLDPLIVYEKAAGIAHDDSALRMELVQLNLPD